MFPKLEKTYVGLMWLLGEDDLVSNFIRQGGYEQSSLDLLGKYLKPGMICIDIGAHVGLYSVFASQKIGNGVVYAFEPDPNPYSALIKNTELYKQIKSFNVGLWEEEIIIDWYDKKQMDTFNVKVGDKILESVSTIDFIKIDVDGGEVGALKGLSRIIKNSPKIMMISEYGEKGIVQVGSKPYTGADYFSLVESFGFEYGRIRDKVVDLKNDKTTIMKKYFKKHCNLLLWKGIEPFWG